jgi:hypothetical protein
LGDETWRLYLRQNHTAAAITAIQNNKRSMMSCFLTDETAV